MIMVIVFIFVMAQSWPKIPTVIPMFFGVAEFTGNCGDVMFGGASRSDLTGFTTLGNPANVGDTVSIRGLADPIPETKLLPLSRRLFLFPLGKFLPRVVPWEYVTVRQNSHRSLLWKLATSSNLSQSQLRLTASILRDYFRFNCRRNSSRCTTATSVIEKLHWCLGTSHVNAYAINPGWNTPTKSSVASALPSSSGLSSLSRPRSDARS